MNMARTLKAPNDRTLNRLIVGSILVLAIGIPLIAVIYVMDQVRDPGPSILERSITAGEEAVRRDPNQVSARLQLATAYIAAERHEDAISQYDEILQVQPDNRAALMGRGMASIALDNLDGAAADFQKVVDLAKGGEMANVDPQLQAAYYQLGSIALKRGQATQALEPLDNAIRIIRTDADALNLYATALIQTGDATTAVKALRRAIALVPSGWCDPYAQLAQAYTALKDTAGARYATGMVAFCEKRPDEATAVLQPLVGGPYAVDAALGLGLIAEEQGDGSTATAMYSKVLKSDPQNFGAIAGLNRLGATPDHGGQAPAAPSVSPSASGSN
jgi:tetratricopeptide (TPR) repeat protein